VNKSMSHYWPQWDFCPRNISKSRLIENGWWAREDSNLQPSGYEHANLAGKISIYWHFRAGSMMFVRVWLRRIIAYLLVGTTAAR
jgi:hypothetical protein